MKKDGRAGIGHRTGARDRAFLIDGTRPPRLEVKKWVSSSVPEVGKEGSGGGDRGAEVLSPDFHNDEM